MPKITETEKHVVKDGVEHHEVKYDVDRSVGEKIKDGIHQVADKVAEGAHKLGEKVSGPDASGYHGEDCHEKTKTKTTVEYK